MRNFVRKNKHDALVREVNLTEANPCFARIRLDDGKEATVSLKDLAPCPPRSHSSKNLENQLNPINDKDVAKLHNCVREQMNHQYVNPKPLILLPTTPLKTH